MKHHFLKNFTKSQRYVNKIIQHLRKESKRKKNWESFNLWNKYLFIQGELDGKTIVSSINMKYKLFMNEFKVYLVIKTVSLAYKFT